MSFKVTRYPASLFWFMAHSLGSQLSLVGFLLRFQVKIPRFPLFNIFLRSSYLLPRIRPLKIIVFARLLALITRVVPGYGTSAP